MAKAGAPKGNSNAKNAKIWQQAIKRALARRSKENVDKGLDEIADKFVEAAVDGDQWAIKEMGDRLDGRPSQMIEGSGDSGEIILKITKDDEGIL